MAKERVSKSAKKAVTSSVQPGSARKSKKPIEKEKENTVAQKKLQKTKQLLLSKKTTPMKITMPVLQVQPSDHANQVKNFTSPVVEEETKDKVIQVPKMPFGSEASLSATKGDLLPKNLGVQRVVASLKENEEGESKKQAGQAGRACQALSMVTEAPRQSMEETQRVGGPDFRALPLNTDRPVSQLSQIPEASFFQESSFQLHDFVKKLSKLSKFDSSRQKRMFKETAATMMKHEFSDIKKCLERIDHQIQQSSTLRTSTKQTLDKLQELIKVHTTGNTQATQLQALCSKILDRKFTVDDAFSQREDSSVFEIRTSKGPSYLPAAQPSYMPATVLATPPLPVQKRTTTDAKDVVRDVRMELDHVETTAKLPAKDKQEVVFEHQEQLPVPQAVTDKPIFEEQRKKDEDVKPALFEFRINLSYEISPVTENSELPSRESQQLSGGHSFMFKSRGEIANQDKAWIFEMLESCTRRQQKGPAAGSPN